MPKKKHLGASIDTPIPSPLPSLGTLNAQLNQITGYASQIPEVRSLAEAAKEGNVRVEERVRAIDDRVTRVEKKLDNGHDCSKLSTLQRLEAADAVLVERVQDGIEASIKARERLVVASGRIDKANEAISKNADGKRHVLFAMVGVVMTVLAGLGGAVWFFSSLNTAVARDRVEGTKQFRHITIQIKAIEEKLDNSKVEAQIRALETAVQRSYEIPIERRQLDMWYYRLPRARKARLKQEYPEADFEAWIVPTEKLDGAP